MSSDRAGIIAVMAATLDTISDASQFDDAGGLFETKIAARVAGLEAIYPNHLTDPIQAAEYIGAAQKNLGAAVTEIFEDNPWRTSFLGAIADGILDALTGPAGAGIFEIIDDRVANLLVGGAGIAISYNDAANTLTISGTGISGSGTVNQVAYWASGAGLTSSAGFMYTEGGSGVSTVLTLKNPDNTNTASHASQIIQVAGASAGNPNIALIVNGVTTWTIGLHNTDNDYLKFGPSASVGTNTYLTMGGSEIWVTTPMRFKDSLTGLRFGGASIGDSIDARIEHVASSRLHIHSDTSNEKVLISQGGGTGSKISLGFGSFSSVTELVTLSNSSAPVFSTASAVSVNLSILAGTGTRAVVASSTGVLSASSSLITGSGAANRVAYWTSASALTYTDDFQFTDSSGSGVSTVLAVLNPNNTSASSHAVINLQTGGQSGGTPKVTWTVPGGAAVWSAGLTNDAGINYWKLSASATVGTNPIIRAGWWQGATSGEVVFDFPARMKLDNYFAFGGTNPFDSVNAYIGWTNSTTTFEIHGNTGPGNTVISQVNPSGSKISLAFGSYGSAVDYLALTSTQLSTISAVGIKFSALAGTGTRPVVASSTGVLSAPSGSVLTTDGSGVSGWYSIFSGSGVIIKASCVNEVSGQFGIVCSAPYHQFNSSNGVGLTIENQNSFTATTAHAMLTLRTNADGGTPAVVYVDPVFSGNWTAGTIRSGGVSYYRIGQGAYSSGSALSGLATNYRLEIAAGGVVKIPNLAGSGSRLVQVDSAGAFSATTAVGTVSGSGTTGTLPYWSASTTLADSILSQASSKLLFSGDTVANIYRFSAGQLLTDGSLYSVVDLVAQRDLGAQRNLNVSKNATVSLITDLGASLAFDSTNADNSFSTSITGFLVKNDSNVRHFHFLRIKPEINAGASNASTTINLLSLDTVNTSLTGVTTNLLKASFGGSQRMLLASNGDFTISPDGTTIGISINSSGVFSRESNSDCYALATAAGLGSRVYMVNQKSRGTIASPTDTVSGDIILGVFSKAYSGSDFQEGAKFQTVIDDTVVSGQSPAQRFEFYTAKNNSGDILRLSIMSNGNIGFHTIADFGNGERVFGIQDCTTAPTTTPSGGGIMYSESGALKWKGGSGTVTTMGNADPHCPVCGADFMQEFESEKYGYLAVCLKCAADEIGERKWILRKKLVHVH